ncbi:glycoside hydrolase family 6 protein [Dactylosporangium sp. CA-139066]|uniref:glycoside hydrolase family 6 protein n=1 Tax=Dactylosporangium sp. CA-139066 TaxID=3239930 RepID=UPI003D8C8776
MANAVAGGGTRATVMLALALGGLGLVAGCGKKDAPAPSAAASYRNCSPATSAAQAVAPGNPLAGRPLFVDPNAPAVQQVERWTGQQRTADATTLRKISDRPAALWVSDGQATVTARVDAVLTCAATQAQLPVLVAYNIPNRDCGKYSSGGAASPDEYKAWIRAFAAGVKGRPVAVVLEPDAIAHAVEGCETDSRYALLSDAVAVLKATGSAAVYVDAGNPRWITDVRRVATALQRSGIDRADGFALNVANFITTQENIAYGKQVSDAVPGKPHFVIDTSRNGAGPVDDPADEINGGPRWCNPPGRLLGKPPTTTGTGDSRVDALLWIKRPGESDGSCRAGEPPAGQWWPEYALDLAQRSP